jgi:ATP-binding cassette, subfamily C, bacterial CydD
MGKVNTHQRLISQAKSGKPQFVGTVLFSFIAASLLLLQAAGLSSVISQVYLEKATARAVTPLIIGIAIVILLRGLCVWGSEITSNALAVRIKQGLRELTVAKLFHLGPAYLQEEQSGELATTINQGIESIDAYFSQFLPQVILAALIPLMILILVFPLDWITGLILLFTAPLIPFFLYLIGRATERVTGRQFETLQRMSAFFLDTLHALATLKIFGRSRERLEEVRKVNEDYRNATMTVLRVTFLSAFALELVATISTALVAVQIGLRLLNGGIAYQQALFILIITPEFYLPLRNLGLRFHAAMNGVTSAERIYAILDQPEINLTLTLKRGNQAERNLFRLDQIRIEFDHVSYHHHGQERSILQDIHFQIPSKKITALVGVSGVGKTTLSQLLLGFIRPVSGRILVNGNVFDEYPIDLWRSQISWVPQRAALFQDTLRANLLIANPDAAVSQIDIALKAAGLRAFIDSLPKGLETKIGEGGTRLSGGERSRLALARAFLRNVPFLIFDESTAYMDVELEKLIEESIVNLCKDKTALIIAHRLNTIRRADQVVVLAEGKVEAILQPRDYFKRYRNSIADHQWMDE